VYSLANPLWHSLNSLAWGSLAWFSVLAVACSVKAQSDFDGPPIHYQTAPVDDAIARLKRALDQGETSLTWDPKNGWLSSLLEELQVPISTQTLVFSKTSLQLSRITPQKPRALYFNDEVYVGWVQHGDVLELSAVDPMQGPIFYTISQSSDRAEITRDRGQCIVCHASSRTQNVPGFLVRSTFPGRDGTPFYGLGTQTTDHTTPLEDRFGGWYVTGQHGSMRHNGNAIAKEDARPAIDRDQYPNLERLDELFDITPYLSSQSDILALMVLEHQSQMHNAITRANYETRMAIEQDKMMNELLQRGENYISESRQRRIASVGDNLLKYLLFHDEFPLTSPIVGDENFQAEFRALGRTDSQGRSLRDFDLQTRLFKYPCSYLIESESYQSLPQTTRDYIEDRLAAIIAGQDERDDFKHLDRATRIALGEILTEMLAGFRERLRDAQAGKS